MTNPAKQKARTLTQQEQKKQQVLQITEYKTMLSINHNKKEKINCQINENLFGTHYY